MSDRFRYIDLRVPRRRFQSWDQFIAEAPEHSIGLEVIDDVPGRRGPYIHFDHHAGVVREATMSAAMQAYIAVRQGKLMQKWLPRRCPIPVYVWNADQDVCLAAFILEYHPLLEQLHADPLLRWIVQFNNKIDVCGGLYPVDLAELVRNHFTWVFEPYREQRMAGKTDGDEALVRRTIRRVCDRLEDLLQGRAGIAPITTEPEILYRSPHGFVIADEKGDPNSRLVLASQGHTNLISRVCRRSNGRYTYSVIGGSCYGEESFPVLQLIQAFQDAEDLPAARIWGGSNLAAGSDSELGSSLDWTCLKEIAEDVIRRTSLADETHAGPSHGSGLRILLAMPPADTAKLEPVMRECGVDVCRASCCAEVRRVLDAGPPCHAIFSTLRLPDGNFCDLAAEERRRATAVPVIVCLPRIDGGWVDLLEAGAFGVIVEPYRRPEVERILDLIVRGIRSKEMYYATTL